MASWQVCIGGVAVEFRVSPVLASILAPFHQHESFTAEQLAAEVSGNWSHKTLRFAFLSLDVMEWLGLVQK